MKIPSKVAIQQYLSDANKRNPGLWYRHSQNTAEAAKRIAEQCPNLDAEVAFAMGALHDIGRREGRSHLHHTIAGYRFMMADGYETIARICLTHSFTVKDLASYSGKRDCTDDELRFLADYLARVDYDDYDRLIQLCDAVGAAEGLCLIEKRLLDVVIRYGTNSYTQAKVAAYRNLRDDFGQKVGTSIYRLLPNVIENTFDFA